MKLNLNALKKMQAKEIYSPGTIIISEGSNADGKVYMILSGTVEVSIEGTPVSTLSDGMVFGEYAIVCDEKRSATVQAKTLVECLILKESDILRFSDETNKLNEILIDRINENTAKNLGIFREE